MGTGYLSVPDLMMGMSSRAGRALSALLSVSVTVLRAERIEATFAKRAA